jgi:hydrogenase maturation protease
MSAEIEARRGKTLVLGIGNEIRGDDGVGIHVARRAAELLPAAWNGRVDVDEACTGGFDLVDYLRGYERAVIADAIQTEGGEAGAVYRFDAAALRLTAHLGHSHGVNLGGALAVLEGVGLGAPRDVVVVAVEAAELNEFTEEMTPAVAAAVEEAAAAVIDELKRWLA